MAMVKKDLLLTKMNTLSRHLSRIRQKREVELKDFLSDLDRQESVLFNLHMAIHVCIDLAAHVVSEEELGVAGSTNELFYLIQEKGLLSADLTEKMVRAVGFRNLLVHEYGRLDLEIVYRAAGENLEDLAEFARVIANRFV
jgi:uncharacterized protein YutE (UPF0331/DUF86 family)